jgi:hypothetical protein
MGNEIFLIYVRDDLYKRHSVLGRTVTELKDGIEKTSQFSGLLWAYLASRQNSDVFRN